VSSVIVVAGQFSDAALKFSEPFGVNCSILKIWNLNAHTGVIGAFNCQGAGWCRAGKKNLIHDVQPGTITGTVRGRDVSRLPDVAGDGWNGDVVVYSHVAREVTVLPKEAALPVTLRPREYEVFTVVPLKRLPTGASFAPIGLIRMFNSGGAVTGVSYGDDGGVEVKVRGAGTVGAYSSVRPKSVAVDAEAVGFSYDDGCGLITFDVGVPEQELYSWTVSIEY
jgi:raffinose synthase